MPDEGAEGLTAWFAGHGFTLKIRQSKYNKPVRTLSFNGHRYEQYSTNNHYAAANEFAVSQGGYVVVVEDDEEAAFISQNFPGSHWLGASDQESEGEWVWAGGELKDEQFWMVGFGDSFSVDGAYGAWADGEPNNADNEDCAIMTPEDGEHVWQDISCTSKHSLLVEYGAPSKHEDHEEL